MSDWLPAFGTAQENFVQAQKWRGITHFGGVPGGQEPNFTKALHYYDGSPACGTAAACPLQPRQRYLQDHPGQMTALFLWSKPAELIIPA